MEIPLLDLKAQYAGIRDEIRQAMDEVCDAQYFILGPKVAAFEEQVAAYCRVPAACGVSSGSDALLMTLMAEGIGAGAEVITSAYTFFATAGAVQRAGATPVFVDIDPVTFNIDPAQIETAITARTKAIIPVHLFGQTADMDPVMALAEAHDLLVIEDACQAIGSEHCGRPAGSIGHYGCLSFFPSKNLGGFGDGGMVVTRDADRLSRLVCFRNHGAEPKYYHSLIGGNFRLDALQAVVLSVKLKYLDRWTEQRAHNAREYAELFSASPVSEAVTLPIQSPSCTRHVHNQFCIRLPAEHRDAVWQELKAAGVGCEVYYPVPLHLQACFADLGYTEGDLPQSESAAKESLALPIYPESTREQRAYVVKTLANILMRRTA